MLLRLDKFFLWQNTISNHFNLMYVYIVYVYICEYKPNPSSITEYGSAVAVGLDLDAFDFEISDLSKSQNVFLAFQNRYPVISVRNNPSCSVYTWAHIISTELNNNRNDLELSFFLSPIHITVYNVLLLIMFGTLFLHTNTSYIWNTTHIMYNI